MPRVPPFDFVKTMKMLMKLNLQATAASLVLATASSVDELVEVVYVPADGQEKGQGVMQCRAKKVIKCGSLRLYA